MLNANIIGGNPKCGRSDRDFYPTLWDVTQALLDYLAIPKDKYIWEPACGDGAMASVIRSNGYHVYETDIALGTDFLQTTSCFCDVIITNPPFCVSEDFIRKCSSYNVPFALLLKSQYWHAAKRVALFDEITPRYVLPLTWRPDFIGNKKPLLDFVWCVWIPGEHETIYQPLKRPKEANHD